MNWGLFATAVSLVIFVAWAWRVSLGGWAWQGLIASLGCMVAATLNSAAPFRGALDPDYVGFGFGLLGADRGLTVTALAGPILLFGTASALIAASRREGPALWVVAATCGALLVIVGIPALAAAVTDPSANSIQLGEYLTIPGIVGTAIMLLLLTFPFAIGAVWAARAAGRPRTA